MHRGRRAALLIAAPGGIEVGDSSDKWMSVCVGMGYNMLQLKTQAIFDSYWFLRVLAHLSALQQGMMISKLTNPVVIFFLDGQYMVNDQPAAELDHVKTYGWFSPFEVLGS